MAENKNRPDITVYDKRDVYNSRIVDIVRNLKLQCGINNLPMFVSVAVKNDENGTEYENDMLLSKAGVRLKDDRISKILLLINNFSTDYPEYIKNDIREISEYMERASMHDEDATEVVLNDDKLGNMSQIIENGDKIKVIDTPEDDDIWNDIDEQIDAETHETQKKDKKTKTSKKTK